MTVALALPFVTILVTRFEVPQKTSNGIGFMH